MEKKKINKPENKIHINTNTKYFLAQYNAVPWNAFQHLDWLRQQRAIPQIELHNMSQYLRSHPPTPSCAPTAGDGNRVHYAYQTAAAIVLTCSWLKPTTTTTPTTGSFFLPLFSHPIPASHHVNMATWRGVRTSTWKCEVKPVQLQTLSS